MNLVFRERIDHLHGVLESQAMTENCQRGQSACSPFDEGQKSWEVSLAGGGIYVESLEGGELIVAVDKVTEPYT